MDEQTCEIAEKTMLGDLMHIIVDTAKALPKPWQQLSEQEQDTWLQSIDKRCKAAISQAVTIIACGNHVSVKATLASVTFKDGVKASVTVDKHSQHRIDLADAAGKDVRLVILDIEGITSENNKPKATKDQRSLDLESNIDTIVDGLIKLATKFVRESRKCTISALQRNFKISHNVASRLLDCLQAENIVSAPDAQGKRVVLTEKKITKAGEKAAK